MKGIYMLVKMANSAKAYSNAEAYEKGCTRSHAQVNPHDLSHSVDNMWREKCSNDEQCNCAEIGRHDADEHCPKPGHTQPASTSSTLSHTSQFATQIQTASTTVSHAPPRETIHETASATIDRTIQCETMTINALASIHKNSMSSQRELIEMVASPPQHSSPCALQLQDASALSVLSHTSPCATQLTNASAKIPMPPPRQSKSKKITDLSYQCKNVSGSMNHYRNMFGSGEQHQDQYTNVPTPGQSNTKTSVVFNNNDTTSAPKGFNHLSQLKGEKVAGPVQYPSTQATTNFSLVNMDIKR